MLAVALAELVDALRDKAVEVVAMSFTKDLGVLAMGCNLDEPACEGVQVLLQFLDVVRELVWAVLPQSAVARARSPQCSRRY